MDTGNVALDDFLFDGYDAYFTDASRTALYFMIGLFVFMAVLRLYACFALVRTSYRGFRLKNPLGVVVAVVGIGMLMSMLPSGLDGVFGEDGMKFSMICIVYAHIARTILRVRMPHRDTHSGHHAEQALSKEQHADWDRDGRAMAHEKSEIGSRLWSDRPVDPERESRKAELRARIEEKQREMRERNPDMYVENEPEKTSAQVRANQKPAQTCASVNGRPVEDEERPRGILGTLFGRKKDSEDPWD